MEHFFSRLQEKVIIRGEEDKVIWLETKSGNFIVKVCVCFLPLQGRPC